MTARLPQLVAMGLAFALFSAAAFAQVPRGMDFRSYLSLERGITEGEVLAIAGPPDAQAEEGAVVSGQGDVRIALVVRTYTYLPTDADPYTTTVTFTGGRVTDVRRDRRF